jgi:hypothetical protein
MKIKVTAIVFIFMANILMVATAVIPHHHHQDRICFQASHCHDKDHHNHEHDNNNDLDCCILHREVLLSSYHVTIETSDYYQDISSVAPEITLLSIGEIFPPSFPFKFPERDRYGSSSTYSSPRCLRAPPAV